MSLSSSSEDWRLSPVCGDELDSLDSSFFSASSSDVSVVSFEVAVFFVGESSSVDIVDVDDSMSECFIVYVEVLMSSVNGVRNETCFVAGNIGFDCVRDILRVLLRGSGLLLRIDVTLYDTLYGIRSGAANISPVLTAELLDVDEIVDAEF